MGRDKSFKNWSNNINEKFKITKRKEFHMKKDAFYFTHDANASNDPKCEFLLSEMGPEGYGIFWVLIEALRGEKDYILNFKYTKSIARRLYIPHDRVLKVIKEFELFEFNEDSFWSKSLLERMEYWDAKKRKMSEAGKRGNEIKKLAKQVEREQNINPEIVVPIQKNDTPANNLNATRTPPDNHPNATRTPPDNNLKRDANAIIEYNRIEYNRIENTNKLCVGVRDETCNFFSVSELNNNQAFMQISNLIEKIEQNGKLEYYKTQLTFYKKFKGMSDEKICSWKTWLLGEKSDSIENGHWCREDYQQKIKNISNGKSKQFVTGATEAIRSGAVKDFGEIKL